MNTQYLDEIEQMAREILEKAGQLRSALLLLEDKEKPVADKPEYEQSGMDEFVGANEVKSEVTNFDVVEIDGVEYDIYALDEFNELSISQLKSMAIHQGFDEEAVANASKDTLRKNVWKDKYKIIYPKTLYEKLREEGDKIVPSEANLGLASLAHLRNFATQVRNIPLETIQHMEQEELYQFLIKKEDTVDTTTEIFTEKELNGKPKARVVAIANAFNIDTTGLVKQQLIEAILKKQEA